MADKEKAQEEEAIRLKTLAESKFNSSNLKSALKYANRAHRLFPSLPGLSEMLTAFNILHSSTPRNSNPFPCPGFYSVLGLDPFSPLTAIKSQYKNLALLIHPDKNTFKNASDEAFKILNDAFQVLSDRNRRKEYDTKLRLALQSTMAAEDDDDEVIEPLAETFRRSARIRVKRAVFSEKSENLEPMKKMSQKSKRCEMSIAEIRAKIAKEKSEIDTRKRGRSRVLEELEKSRPKKTRVVERELTLAEMKLEALKKLKGKNKDSKNSKIREEIEEEEKKMVVENGDMEVMAVEDSDFYDFDIDRVEKSFKKGQVWAIYDDDDGMPRHYGLIDEVVSVNPFEVKMSWLDHQNNGDDRVICLEKLGFHISCGRFKVAKKDTINLLNIFSHLVECERAAKMLYQIYPKKGSIWALYNERALDMDMDMDMDGRNCSSKDNRDYDIVVFLTSYSEMHGLSMAYLEKVDGFKAVFKRRAIGYHAIRWLEKDEIRLFSHQIPARKLSGDEAPNLLGDCWELDPASLPQDLLMVT